MKKSNRNIKQDFIYLKEDRYKKPKEVHKKYVDLLKKEKITSNTSLLDVGCAGGELIFNIKKKFPKINITGIDIHQPLLDKAKRKTFKDIVYKKKDISRKNDSKERLGGTIGSSLFAIMQGVQILRVHNVNEVIQSIKIFKELLKK